MTAPWMFATVTLRKSAGSVVVLTLLIGLVGTVVLTSFAGARRTASAFERFREETLAADLTVFSPRITDRDIKTLSALPGVKTIGRGRELTSEVDGSFVSLGGPLDGATGRSVTRPRLVSGRRPHQDRAREIAVPETFARVHDVGIGDTFVLRTYGADQIADFLAGTPVNEPTGPAVRMRVVGITRAPGDLSIEGASGGLMFTTAAFLRRYGDDVGSFAPVVLLVRVADEEAATRFVRAARARVAASGAPGEFQVQPTSETEGAVQESIDVLATGLLVFACIAGLVGLVVVALALRRFVDRSTSDLPALRAIGSSRAQRVLALALPMMAIAAGGALLAVGGASLASPLMPIGLARDAEPSIGFDLDALVLGVGVVAVAVLAGGVGFLVASMADRTERQRTGDAAPSSVLVSRAVGAGLAPPLVVGATMALEPGRGRSAVPVRQGIVAVGLSIAGIVAVVMFAASLDRLVRTPRAYGYNWDAHFDYCQVNLTDPQNLCGASRFVVARDPAVAAAATISNNGVEVDGHPITAMALGQLRGRIEPTVVEGRAARTAREVALGTDTLSGIGASIGDRVRIAGPEGEREFRVVGRVALPVFTAVGEEGDLQAIADGAMLTARGLRAIGGSGLDGARLVVRWRPGADRVAAVARFRKQAEDIDRAKASVVPLEVERLEQVDALPWALGAFLAVIGILGVGYTIVVGVRRRGRDLAVLKTVGFRRRQVVTTVATQATLLAVVGLLVGMPLGVVIGRFVWERIAAGAGFQATDAAPVGTLAAVVVLSLVAVNAVALFPARRAARTHPARVLRSE
jgi:putative ABC transport system permease protein